MCRAVYEAVCFLCLLICDSGIHILLCDNLLYDFCTFMVNLCVLLQMQLLLLVY